MPDPDPGWTLDPRLNNVPPSLLRGRVDQPVRITSPALEWTVIQLGNITSPFGRALFQWEFDVVNDISQGSVDASRIRVVETSVLAAPTTLGNQIRVVPGWSFENDNRPVLVHEVGHVWQYQTRGTNYVTCSVYHNASGQIGTGNRNVAYMNYQLSNNSSMGQFTAEEQATIIGDYYELTRIYHNDPNPPPWVGVRGPDLPIYERLMAEVRSSTPRSESIIYQQSLMNQPNPAFNFEMPGEQRFLPVMPLLEIRFKGL